jgi:hypothetical protein
MLDARQGDPPERLTVDELEGLHQRATENTYRGNLLQLTYQSQLEDLDEQQRQIQILQYMQDARIPSDLRQGPTRLALRLEGETTEQGRQQIEHQILEQDFDGWFEIQPNSPPGEFVLIYPDRTPEQCRQRAQAILDDFYNRLPQAQTGQEKRLLIAETVQRLYRSHLFKDGNTRTIVFTAMNRMLLDAGLSPAILPEPKGAGGFSLQQFSDEILKGQFVFRCMSKDPSVGVAQFLQAEIDRHIESERVPVEQAVAYYRTVINGNEAIPETYRNQLLTGLDRLLEGVDNAFYQNVLNEPFYGCLKRDDVWRLFAGEQPDDLTRTAMERQFDVLLALRRDGQPLTPETVERVNQQGPNPGFVEGRNPDECRQKIKNCLEDFQVAMNFWKREERSESQKLSQIAMIIHELYAPPVFKDPSTGLMLLQYMMLEAGLPPAMLDPSLIPTTNNNLEFELFGSQVANGQLAFAWRTKDPSLQAETFLRHRLDGLVKTEKLPFEEACERLKSQIDGNPMISDDDQAELLSKLNAIVTARQVALSDELNNVEDQLHGLLREVPAFGGIKRDELWRLFATGRELNPEGPNPLRTREEFLVRHGPESLVRLERAFLVMMEGCLHRTPLDSDYVMQINGQGPNPGFRRGPTVLTTRSRGFDPDLDELERLRRGDPWFRGMEIGGDRRDVIVEVGIGGERRTVERSELESTFTLPDAPSDEFCRKRLDLILEQYRLDIEMIDSGRDGIGTELVQSYEKRVRSEVRKEQERQLELGGFGRPISDEEVNDRVNERVGRFVENLGQRIDEEVTRRKEEVIAKAVQDLYRSQLFDEGTRQYTVFMVMNRMRLDAGLPPAILHEPEQVFAQSTRLVNLLINLEGKNVYKDKEYVPKDEKKVDLILKLEDFPNDDDNQIVELLDDIVEIHDERILLDDPLREGLSAKFEVNRAKYIQWLSEQVLPGDDVDDNDIVHVDNLQGQKIPVLRAGYQQWREQQIILVEDPAFGRGITDVKIVVDRDKYVQWLRDQPPPGDDVDEDDIIRVDNPNVPGEKIPVVRGAYTEWIDQQRGRDD